jgi:hypothetical protein
MVFLVCWSAVACAPATVPATASSARLESTAPLTTRSATPGDQLKTLPRIGDRYVVDGDLLLTEAEALKHLGEQTSAPRVEDSPGQDTGYLILAQSGVWPARTARNLTFAIDRTSFQRDDQYELVKANLAAAANEWSKACPSCGVKFVHVDELDAKNPTPENVLFVARYRDVGGAFIAAAFFANDPQNTRFLEIDPSYFTTAFDRVGVFRHELGHVLGYRHEHIRGVPGCSPEGGKWTVITPYDPKSVMHYLCGGVGSRELKISQLDRTGHEAAYGGRAP